VVINGTQSSGYKWNAVKNNWKTVKGRSLPYNRIKATVFDILEFKISIIQITPRIPADDCQLNEGKLSLFLRNK